MKKQITIALLLVISTFAACKKEKGAHVDIIGVWKVTKVETTVAGAATVTYTGVPADSFEFRSNEGNEMVVNLNSTSTIGSYYVLVNDDFKFTYNGRTRSGSITTISESKLEFTGTVEGATPKTTEKYYLTK
jgi:hypothetical protein